MQIFSLMCRSSMLALLLLLCTCISATGTKPPHIILALVDDLGWNGFDIYGNNKEVKAPHIHDLAAGGVVLENYYVYPFCSPSRAALLTGRVPGHGIWESNPDATAAVGVNLKMDMMPAMLKRAGYRTHLVGKWHQGAYMSAYTPVFRGFDTSFGYLLGASDHFTNCAACGNNIPGVDYSDHRITCPADVSKCNVTCPDQGGVDLWRNNGPAKGENGTWTAHLFSNEAVKIISENDGTPMFMYLALHNVHQPVEVPPDMLAHFPESDYNETNMARRYYNAMHFSVDCVLSNVTAALKAKGMYENTVIVFSSDNGGTFEHRGDVPGSSNYPLRGHKYSYFDGGVRALGFIHSPLLPRGVQGTKTSTLLHITDWYVTFCVLAGLADCSDSFADAPLDGIDAWPFLAARQNAKRPASRWANKGGPGEDELMLGVGHGTSGAIRVGHMKLIIGGVKRLADGWSAQYPGSTTAIPPPAHVACAKTPCLFNVTADQREMHDLADSQPDLREKMLARYRELAKAMDVPNGYEEALEKLVWTGAYHVPRVADEAACKVVKETGFWGPWVSRSGAAQASIVL